TTSAPTTSPPPTTPGAARSPSSARTSSSAPPRRAGRRDGRPAVSFSEGHAVIKSISLLTRKDGWTHEQFVRHWVDVHAPLAHAVPGLRRYVQSHIVEERRRPDVPPLDVEVDGIAELSYDSREAMAAALATPAAKALYAD